MVLARRRLDLAKAKVGRFIGPLRGAGRTDFGKRLCSLVFNTVACLIMVGLNRRSGSKFQCATV
jgi:hypothetical protein